MNKKHLEIISNLRKNARISLTTLSRRLNVPVSTIFARLKASEKDFIIKHTCLLDVSKLGYNVRSYISLKVDRDNKQELREYLLKHPSLNSVYKINNGFDFMVEGIFKQIKEMDDFIEKLESRFNIIDKNSYFIVEDLKKEEFLADLDILGFEDNT